MIKKLSYCSLLLPAVASAAQSQQPDILWIITDDQRADALECYNRATRGSSENELGYVSSPNIDKLASEGVLFTSSFCNTPVSAPSRGSMHTGRYPFHSGIYSFEVTHNTSDFAKPLVPEVMAQAGYQTATFGKTGYYIFKYSEPMRYTDAQLYQVAISDKDYSQSKMSDWYKRGVWDKKGQVGNLETWNYPDGSSVEYYISHRDGLSAKDKAETKKFRKSQDIITSPGKVAGAIIAGVNTMPTDKTLDGRTTEDLALFLQSQGSDNYTSIMGKKVAAQDAEKPQFIHFGYHFPHTPVLPSKEYRDKFMSKKYKVPTLTDEEYSKMPAQVKKWQSAADIRPLSQKEQMQCIRDYYAFCAMGDELIGKAVSEFKASAKRRGREYLIILATGDHGWHLGEQGVYAKSSGYLKSNQTAVVVVSSDKSKFPAGKVVKDFIEYVDFAPTLFAAAGVNVDAKEYDYLDGRDIANTVAGEVTPRDYVLGETYHIAGPRAYMRSKEFSFSMRSRKSTITAKYPPLMDIKWALNCSPEEAEMALFDLRSDPNENNNIAYDPRYEKLAAWFRSKLGNIVLGDGRVECNWKAPRNTFKISNFAPGSDNKRLDIPTNIIPSAK